MSPSDSARRSLYVGAVVFAAAALISVPVANRAQEWRQPAAAPTPMVLRVQYESVANPFAIDAAVAPTPAPTQTPSAGANVGAAKKFDPHVPGINNGAAGAPGGGGVLLAVTLRPDGNDDASVLLTGARDPVTVRVGSRIGKLTVKRIDVDDVLLSDGTQLRPSTSGDYALEQTSVVSPPADGRPDPAVPGLDATIAPHPSTPLVPVAPGVGIPVPPQSGAGATTQPQVQLMSASPPRGG